MCEVRAWEQRMCELFSTHLWCANQGWLQASVDTLRSPPPPHWCIYWGVIM